MSRRNAVARDAGSPPEIEFAASLAQLMVERLLLSMCKSTLQTAWEASLQALPRSVQEQGDTDSFAFSSANAANARKCRRSYRDSLDLTRTHSCLWGYQSQHIQIKVNPVLLRDIYAISKKIIIGRTGNSHLPCQGALTYR